MEKINSKQLIESANTVVIKAGSTVVCNGSGADAEAIACIVKMAKTLAARGKKAAIVTSGAVATGKTAKKDGKGDRASLSAIGQAQVIGEFSNAAARNGTQIGQVLVSQGDFGKDGGKTISKAIENVIDAGVIPVINENDAVYSGGAKFFHDNDDLASQLGTLLGAEVLVMLSNVDGVIDKDAKAVIPVVYDADAALENDYGTCNGLGGLKAKIKAAKAFVQNGGKAAIIASGRTAGGGLPISFRDGATCTIFPSKELTA